LTQQRFGHTNSVEILRANEGRMDTRYTRLRVPAVPGVSS
jgi:hypothetical protein